jgi:Domain of unknown function (DUF397)
VSIQQAAQVKWRKSTRSQDPSQGMCVEVAALGAARGIRDSKNPAGAHLSVSAPALGALIAAIKADHLDL